MQRPLEASNLSHILARVEQRDRFHPVSAGGGGVSDRVGQVPHGQELAAAPRVMREGHSSKWEQ